jgi:hypothetical protein
VPAWLRADEASLYPALHRMEEDGWIRADDEARWPEQTLLVRVELYKPVQERTTLINRLYSGYV